MTQFRRPDSPMLLELFSAFHVQEPTAEEHWCEEPTAAEYLSEEADALCSH